MKHLPNDIQVNGFHHLNLYEYLTKLTPIKIGFNI